MASHHRRSGSVLVVALAVAVLGGLMGTFPVGAAEHPEVVSGVWQDPRTITPARRPAPFASLHVPQGRWVAWVVVRWDVTANHGGADVRCWTTLSGGGELDRHGVRAWTKGGYGGLGTPFEPIPDSLEMSVAGNVTPVRGGVIQVRCRKGEEDGHSPIVVLREVRVAALQAGRLTIISPSGTSSSGKGAPYVVQSRRPGPVTVPTTDATKPIAHLDLTPGAWWVRTHLTVEATHSTPWGDVSDWRCTLALGDAVDRTGGQLRDDDLTDDRSVATMELATQLESAAAVQLRCGAPEPDSDYDPVPDPDPRVRDVRITAVKAGSLTLGDGSEDATWTSTGSGPPRVVHARLDESGPISDTSDDVTVAEIPLAGGRWLVTAKYRNDAPYQDDVPDFPSVLCRLRLRSQTGATKAAARAYGPGVPVQIVGVVGRRGAVSLDCRWQEDTSLVTRLKRVRMTAVRVR